MKTKCYSVRLKSLDSISVKAFKASDFKGNVVVLPKSQVFGRDYDIAKSEAYWISAWILEKKEIQYSRKKEALFDSKSGQMVPSYKVEKHTPVKRTAILTNEIKKLKHERAAD